MPRRDPETLSLAAPSCFPRLPGCAREGPVLTRAHFWLQGLVRWQLGTRSLRQVRDPPVALPTSGLLPVGLHLEWPHLPGTLGRGLEAWWGIAAGPSWVGARDAARHPAVQLRKAAGQSASPRGRAGAGAARERGPRVLPSCVVGLLLAQWSSFLGLG